MERETPRSADGTQPAKPVDTFADPLSDMVGGDAYRSVPDESGAPPAGPVPAPDPETVRALVEGVFAPRQAEEYPEPTEHLNELDESDEDDSAPGEAGEPVTPFSLPGGDRRSPAVPQQRRTWPIYRRLSWQTLRPRGRVTPRRSHAPVRRPRGGKPSRGSAGLVIALVLLGLFCFVAVELVISLMNTFSGIAE